MSALPSPSLLSPLAPRCSCRGAARTPISSRWHRPARSPGRTPARAELRQVPCALQGHPRHLVPRLPRGNAKAHHAADGHARRLRREGKKCVELPQRPQGTATSSRRPSSERFDHAARTGVALAGKHATVACACLPHQTGRTGPLINIKPLATAAAATRTRTPGTLGASCKSCHAPTAWNPPPRRIADHKVPMTGGHQGLACEQCHTRGRAPRRDAPLVRRLPRPEARRHQGAVQDLPQRPRLEVGTFQHDFCTCILPGKHQTAPCLACHPAFKFKPTPFACAALPQTRIASTTTRRLRALPLGACRGRRRRSITTSRDVGLRARRQAPRGRLRELPHEEGRLQGRAAACEGCHKVPQHGDFGALRQLPCTAGGFDQQHVLAPTDPLPARRASTRRGLRDLPHEIQAGRIHARPSACVLCHGDPHRSQFSTRRVASWLKDIRTAHCRAWTRLSTDRRRAPRHRESAYALEGKARRRRPRRRATPRLFVDTPRGCAQCHVDRHSGRFGGECARCHDAVDWRHHPGFDHAETGFVSRKPTPASPARTAMVRLPGLRAATLAAAGEDAKVGCATCPHAAPRREPSAATARAATRPTQFSDVPRVRSRADDVPARSPPPRRALHHLPRRRARAALIPTAATCHGDPHRGRAQLDCGECHRAESRIGAYHVRSEFPLRGRHFTTPCRDCHVNDQFTGVRAECVGCHRGVPPARRLTAHR